jgi:hypothetical protein
VLAYKLIHVVVKRVVYAADFAQPAVPTSPFPMPYANLGELATRSRLLSLPAL